jgi:hypothetical protein
MEIIEPEIAISPVILEAVLLAARHGPLMESCAGA